MKKFTSLADTLTQQVPRTLFNMLSALRPASTLTNKIYLFVHIDSQVRYIRCPNAV